MKIFWALEGESKSYKDVPEKATILLVNNKLCHGICPVCKKAIVDGEDYITAKDWTRRHTSCVSS